MQVEFSKLLSMGVEGPCILSKFTFRNGIILAEYHYLTVNFFFKVNQLLLACHMQVPWWSKGEITRVTQLKFLS